MKSDMRQMHAKPNVEDRLCYRGENSGLYKGGNNKWNQAVSSGKGIFGNYTQPLKGRPKIRQNSTSVNHHSP